MPRWQWQLWHGRRGLCPAFLPRFLLSPSSLYYLHPSPLLISSGHPRLNCIAAYHPYCPRHLIHVIHIQFTLPSYPALEYRNLCHSGICPPITYIYKTIYPHHPHTPLSLHGLSVLFVRISRSRVPLPSPSLLPSFHLPSSHFRRSRTTSTLCPMRPEWISVPHKKKGTRVAKFRSTVRAMRPTGGGKPWSPYGIEAIKSDLA